MANIFDFGLQNYTLRLSGLYRGDSVFAVVGDTARRLEVQVLDSTGVVRDTSGLSLRLSTEVGGQATYVDAEVVDAAKGLYRIDLTNGMLLKPGKQEFQWTVTDASGNKIHSSPFTGVVAKNITEGGSQSYNFYLSHDELKENIKEVKDMQKDLVDGAVDSAAIKQNAEERYSELEAEYAEDLSTLKQSDENITAQLAKTPTYDEVLETVPFSKFIDDAEETHVDAFNRALNYCKTNKVSLDIADGEYIIDDIVTVDMNWDGFTIKGNSRDVVFLAKTEGVLFHIQSHRVRFLNFKIKPFNETFNHKFQAIQWDGAQGLCDNYMIQRANIGIVADVSCWCTNFTKTNMTDVNKGFVFKYSGGCLVQIELLSGSAGYVDAQPNGSIGIEFTNKSGMQTVADGGQIESFHYAYDIKKNTHITIGNVFTEHNLQTFTDDSKIDYLISPNFYDVSRNTTVKNVSKVTLNGMDKAALYNDAKDSAIPLSQLKTYFLFDDLNGELIDFSGNSSQFNSHNLQLSSNNGLYGKQLQMVSLGGSGSYGSVNIPELSNDIFTVVLSFKVGSLRDTATRTLELTAPDGSVVFLSNDIGISISETIEGNSTKLETIKRIQSTDYNQFIALTFNTLTGDITINCPELPTKTIFSKGVRSFSNGFNTNDFRVLRNFTNAAGSNYLFNYLMVFNGSINYKQMINIYKQTTPILTIPMYKKLASLV